VNNIRIVGLSGAAGRGWVGRKIDEVQHSGCDTRGFNIIMTL